MIIWEPDRPNMTDLEQFQCLNILDYVIELFQCSRKESFTPAQVVSVLTKIKHDFELFDPLVIAAQEEATDPQRTD